MIAKLVQADEDTVRDVIHQFNEIGLACLDPLWGREAVSACSALTTRTSSWRRDQEPCKPSWLEVACRNNC